MRAELPLQTLSTAALAASDPVDLPVAAVVLLDAKGCIADMTADAASLLGYAPEAVVGRQLHELAAPEWKAVVQAVTARILFGATEPFDLMLCGRSGRRVMVRLRARLLDDTACAPGMHVVVWNPLVAPAAGPHPRVQSEAELRRLAYDLLATQEQERSRVAAELHDGVGPLVFMAKLMIEDGLQRLREGAAEQAFEALLGAIGRLRDVASEVGRISSELRPRMLDDLGLLPTIEWYCRTFNGACPATELTRRVSAEEGRIPRPLKLEIFRIVQEALNNVAQHAEARHARVELVLEGAELRLTVEDDGVGFDAARLVYGDACLLGVGLQSIRKRVCATRGRLLLESTPGAGTRVGAVWRLEPH